MRQRAASPYGRAPLSFACDTGCTNPLRHGRGVPTTVSQHLRPPRRACAPRHIHVLRALPTYIHTARRSGESLQRLTLTVPRASGKICDRPFQRGALVSRVLTSHPHITTKRSVYGVCGTAHTILCCAGGSARERSIGTILYRLPQCSVVGDKRDDVGCVGAGAAVQHHQRLQGSAAAGDIGAPWWSA